MKILTKNVVISILKVGIVTALLATLMLLGVDLFKNLDKYTDYRLTAPVILKLTLLYAPESFLTALGPSFLFAVTYYLSMLHANNEIISVLNAGIQYKKVILPCIITGVLVSVFYFGFNETIAINSSNLKETKTQEETHIDKSKKNNTNVALADVPNGYMVYASKYIDKDKTLLNVTFIEKNSDNNEIRRTDAYKAKWSEESHSWTMHDCYIYVPAQDGLSASIEHIDLMEDSPLKLEPELFRNMSSEVSKMDLRLASQYLNKVKVLNPVQYASIGTEFYKRIFSCLTPLVMIIIACSMNYRFKKNVLFFSIISSLCVAVVYYVVQMVTMMLANQGVIKPYLGVLIPFGAILLISGLLSLLLRN